MFPDYSKLAVFVAAVVVLAATPGPGMLYVLARTVKGGRRAGFLSVAGTGLGGLCHVVAAALGLSAILAASAVAFQVVKYAGSAYLIYLGVRTLLERKHGNSAGDSAAPSNAFRQGVLTELLNPKTALFFLAFIPQFINPHGHVTVQFLFFGAITAILNTSADCLVAALAGPISQRLRSSPKLNRRQRTFSGCTLIGLGAYVAVADSN